MAESETANQMGDTLTAREKVLWEAAVVCGRIANFAATNGGGLPPSLTPEKLYELSGRIDDAFADGYMADDAVAHEVAVLGDVVRDRLRRPSEKMEAEDGAADWLLDVGPIVEELRRRPSSDLDVKAANMLVAIQDERAALATRADRLAALVGEWESAADPACPSDHRPDALRAGLSRLLAQAADGMNVLANLDAAVMAANIETKRADKAEAELAAVLARLGPEGSHPGLAWRSLNRDLDEMRDALGKTISALNIIAGFLGLDPFGAADPRDVVVRVSRRLREHMHMRALLVRAGDAGDAAKALVEQTDRVGGDFDQIDGDEA